LPVVQPWQHVSFRLEANGQVAFPDSRVLPPPATNVAHWHLSAEEIAWIVCGVIVIGIALRFVLLLAGLRRLKQFRERATAIFLSPGSGELLEAMRARVGCAAEFRLSRDVESPVTFGLVSPAILLPESFFNLESNLQRAIACHELLHVRRRDWGVHFLEEIVR